MRDRPMAVPGKPSRRDRPHVIVNMAMSADGKVDTVARRGARISSAADTRRVDELRAAVDAILVGGRTLLAEDPRLTVRAADLLAARRAAGRAAQPARVGVASDLSGAGADDDARSSTPGTGLRADGRFVAGEPARVVLFTSKRTPPATRATLARAGAEVVVLGERRVDLGAALAHLAATGVERLLVEGGGTIVEALLRDGLVDEIELYVAPLVIGGRDAPTPAEGQGFAVEDAVRLELVASNPLRDGGVVLRYRVAPGDEKGRRAGAPHEET